MWLVECVNRQNLFGLCSFPEEAMTKWVRRPLIIRNVNVIKPRVSRWNPRFALMIIDFSNIMICLIGDDQTWKRSLPESTVASFDMSCYWSTGVLQVLCLDLAAAIFFFSSMTSRNAYTLEYENFPTPSQFSLVWLESLILEIQSEEHEASSKPERWRVVNTQLVSFSKGYRAD